uniref:PGG domain-containing protein n=1 Tax=Leersia perrieri TaxID=77586 RepID=A0A0D9WSA9_9ORYZ
MAATAAATATAAKAALLFLLVINIVSVLAVAARPLEGDGWLESGIGMVTEMLRAAKSGPSGRTHCC